MDASIALVLLVVVTVPLAIAVSVGGSIDAASYSRAVWTLAGFHRSRWIGQALGFLFFPLALVYSGIYFFRVRPRLRVASAGLDDHVVGQETYRRTDRGISGPAPAAPDVASAAVVKIRANLPTRFMPLLSIVVFAAVALLTAGSKHAPPSFVWAELTVVAVLGCAGTSWFGIDLTPTEAVVHSLRRRRIPWERVGSVQQESFLGGRRVVLWTIQNERIPLRAPALDFTSLGRRQFEADFRLIGNWWIEHADVDSAP